jgi:hypothetical protein
MNAENSGRSGQAAKGEGLGNIERVCYRDERLAEVWRAQKRLKQAYEAWCEAREYDARPETQDSAVSFGRVNSESDERVVNNDVRHQYRVLTEAEKSAMVRLKDLGLMFMRQIDDCVPAGREASLAKTKVEEAIMWAVKGLTA